MPKYDRTDLQAFAMEHVQADIPNCRPNIDVENCRFCMAIEAFFIENYELYETYVHGETLDKTVENPRCNPRRN